MNVHVLILAPGIILSMVLRLKPDNMACLGHNKDKPDSVNNLHLLAPHNANTIK